MKKRKRTEYLSSILRIIRVERNTERDRWEVGPMAGGPILEDQEPYSKKEEEIPIHKERSWQRPSIYPLKVGYVNKLVDEGILKKSGNRYNLSESVETIVRNLSKYEEDIHPSFEEDWEKLKKEYE